MNNLAIINQDLSRFYSYLLVARTRNKCSTQENKTYIDLELFLLHPRIIFLLRSMLPALPNITYRS